MSHLTPGQHIHLVGIGGAGLSAIARILLGQGYTVSGSDRSLNGLTEALSWDGATIYRGHDAANVTGADALIISSAVKPDHPEVAAARTAGIPVYKRSDIMADLMAGKTVIAVAGTAGKTTTTAMIAHILIETGRDPSYIIGGVLTTTGQNAGVGAGDAFVVEADEYDNMFLGLHPNIAVVTNVEWDHPDFFKTPEDMQRSFEQFIDLLPYDGTLILNVDLPMATPLRRQSCVTYGRSPAAEWHVANARNVGERLQFDIGYRDQMVMTAALRVPGVHNALNALAAMLAVSKVGEADFESSAKALSTFKGTARRFELKGEVDGIAVIDDYAHHPAKIRATLQAARERYPDRQIWAVWQPHTYSRTQALMGDFLTAFGDADHVLITEIYAAREQPIPGVGAADLATKMDHPDARFVATFADAVAALEADVQPPAAVIVMSAGDAPQIGAEFLKYLTQRRKG